MSSVYIHIPFCLQACHYCDFHFSTTLKLKDVLVDAIIKEITIRKKEFNKVINSLYIGGGTPSILQNIDYIKIFNAIKQHSSISSSTEITLEINPEDATKEKLSFYRSLGVNRLSIGAQSLNNKVLKWMNRAHDKKQIIKSVELSKSVGFSNYNIDFIYGLPLSINRNLEEEINELISLEPNHLSCYHLTIEKGTYFNHLKSKSKLEELNDENSEKEFNQIRSILKENGLYQYEISNYCKSGSESIHNSNYWNNEPYIGIGPSAHSYDKTNRRWNISNNPIYIKRIMENDCFYELEELNKKDMFNECVLLGLRTSKGLFLEKIKGLLNKEQQLLFNNQMNQFLKDGLLELTDGYLHMAKKKRLLAEYVSREFFIIK